MASEDPESLYIISKLRHFSSEQELRLSIERHPTVVPIPIAICVCAHGEKREVLGWLDPAALRKRLADWDGMVETLTKVGGPR